jgi:S-adenosylmethionine:tRNA ribosyltransferase-isomerase
MQLSDFNYDLPPELIAQHPLVNRSDSRLLEVAANGLRDRAFVDISQIAKPGDLFIFNDTKVIPARLYGHKETGGQVELLIERITGENRAWVQIRASKTPKVGGRIHIQNKLGEHIDVEILQRMDRFYEIAFQQNVLELLDRFGELPLPHYIEHQADRDDAERYQTVLASNPGAVAAPTAGLHFDDLVLGRLANNGVERATITLHVGAGTFTPVHSEDLSQHKMHYEWYSIPEKTIEAIAQTKLGGGRVIAIGTTSLRTLESYALNHKLTGDTNLFITPGFEFRIVDALVTNFHLPKSTLLMLVSAFAGMETIREVYRHAIAERYRFFSYGDAMFLNRST